MAKKLYVGNLPFTATEDELKALFSESGAVDTAQIIINRDTGRSKGFGFIEMSNDDEAQAAIAKFHGYKMGGRDLVVNEARPMAPRTDRPRRSFAPRDEQASW